MKKNKFRKIINKIVEQRVYFSLLFSFSVAFIFVVTDLILALIYLYFHKTSLWVSYNTFTLDSYSTDSWLYFFLWMIFDVMIFVINIIISVKFLKSKHYNLASFVILSGIITIVISGVFLDNIMSI